MNTILKSIFTLIFSIFFLLLTFVKANAQESSDWPQYLGPNRDNISQETDLTSSWSKEGPKVLWSQAVGEGFGGPSIYQAKVYVLDRENSEKDILRCFDLNSGEELWNYSHIDSGKFSFNGSRATPTVDGKNIYCVGPMGTIYCIDLLTHQSVWTRNFREDFGAEFPTWAFSQSPLIYKDLVIVAPMCNKTGLVAYDKENGEIVWQTPRLSVRAGYSSPQFAKIGGLDQIILVTPYMTEEMIQWYNEEEKDAKTEIEGAENNEEVEPYFDHGGVYGINAKTGKVLWNYKKVYGMLSIPPVTLIGDGRVFVNSGDSSLTMIQIENNNGRFKVNKLFEVGGLHALTHPAILYDNHLYYITTENKHRYGLVCMSLDGEILWSTGRKPNFDRGGFILADDKLYVMHGTRGDLYLVQSSSEGYKELGKANLLKRSLVWAPMALAEGKLVIRDQKQIKCVYLK
jgi:outer membrane protein assembly factor BamB